MTLLIGTNQVLRATRKMAAVACFDAPDGRTMVTWSHRTASICDSWVDDTRAALRPTQSNKFAGGVVGWLSYEAGGQVERMPSHRQPHTGMKSCLWRVEGALHFDPTSEDWSVHGSPAFKAEAQAVLKEAATCATEPLNPHQTKPWAPAQPTPIEQAYTAGVSHILEAIRQGEVYQVNLAWEHTGVRIDDAIGAWLALRDQNPAQYGAYLRHGDTEVVSNSPELFLEIDGKTGRIQSRPIKGTAPLGNESRRALESSTKERAELTMIVDLVRNDLGRVCQAGTVDAQPRTIRQCGDLWHAEQTVSATLRRDQDAVDALCATFPPGSVTGAPKVRAMEVIHDLEPGPRGVYTGAIGWLSDNGDARFSVAIRTAPVQDGRGRFHVGAGIVADSHPDKEWRETLAKAQALAHSLGA